MPPPHHSRCSPSRAPRGCRQQLHLTCGLFRREKHICHALTLAREQSYFRHRQALLTLIHARLEARMLTDSRKFRLSCNPSSRATSPSCGSEGHGCSPATANPALQVQLLAPAKPSAAGLLSEVRQRRSRQDLGWHRSLIFVHTPHPGAGRCCRSRSLRENHGRHGARGWERLSLAADHARPWKATSPPARQSRQPFPEAGAARGCVGWLAALPKPALSSKN